MSGVVNGVHMDFHTTNLEGDQNCHEEYLTDREIKKMSDKYGIPEDQIVVVTRWDLESGKKWAKANEYDFGLSLERIESARLIFKISHSIEGPKREILKLVQ